MESASSSRSKAGIRCRESSKWVASKLLPHTIYRRAAALWHLRGHFIWASRTVLNQGWPKTLLHFGVAPGDDLLCTAVLRELKRRGHRGIWMMSHYPDLFYGNRDVDYVVPPDHHFRTYLSLFGGKWRYLEYASFDKERDMSIPPQQHIIAELCSCAGIKGDIVLRPYFHLSKDEEKAGKKLGNNLVAIQSSGLAGKHPIRNKQWFPERFEEVVKLCNSSVKFVQVGSSSDPELTGVTDLRGKTSIRETAALLANCRLYVGNVGFLMHLARAVDCPSIIVYGGREAPWQSGYSCNINLYSSLPCAPCWLWNTCDHDRLCMTKIRAGDLIRALEQMLGRPRSPLSEDRCEVK